MSSQLILLVRFDSRNASVATLVTVWGHVQTLMIIGSMKLGWPLIIEQFIKNINMPIMGYPWSERAWHRSAARYP